MRLLAALFVYLLHTAAAGAPADDEKKAECAETKSKIRKIESRMRQGYTAKQGMKMEDELRRLRERRKNICR